MPRKYRIIERKLGREQADAIIDFEARTITVDPTLSPKRWLYRLAHEAVHAAFPELEEEPVKRAERVIGDILWRAGVRRIHQ